MVGLKMKGPHQLLVYADDVKPVGDNITTIRRNIEALTLVHGLL
jgi:hypothetical protein